MIWRKVMGKCYVKNTRSISLVFRLYYYLMAMEMLCIKWLVTKGGELDCGIKREWREIITGLAEKYEAGARDFETVRDYVAALNGAFKRRISQRLFLSLLRRSRWRN
ncbi:MAG: hypothetical protein ACLU4N_14980 [Butyricimonas faecihominis]